MSDDRAAEYLALSVVTPGGSAIASGRKTIEVRSWQPHSLPLKDLLIIENRRRLDIEGDFDPDGFVVAVVDVVSIAPWTSSEVEHACATSWAPGYWAWRLSNVRRVASPLQAEARRGLYQITLPRALSVQACLAATSTR
ncbi:ASCH domain-containing protein [Caldimonas sp. KR1-144]|uniref:ASCH domain-containing protein n=1 Tax=Caldimonas sp. KR1-144 TaxID=3400911 RepID=UPI003C0C581B